MKLKPLAKALIAILIIGGIVAGLKFSGLLDRAFQKSVVVTVPNLGTAPANATTVGLKFAGLPSKSASSKVTGKARMEIRVMAWNSQLGLMFANGGSTTTEGSLMEKYGVNLTIVRQGDDDIPQATQELIKFAKDYKDNPATATGVTHFAMMGDGTPATLASINQELKKLGDDYIAEVIFSCGRSNGEDALMAPISWRQNPKNAIGGVVATVLRDGDWNIVIKWAADNGIKINPDERTYDPDAINFIASKNNVESGKQYIAGYKETRPVVKDGKKTGETKEIGVDAVSVWTPVDVTVAESKGGLVRIVSTKEYSAQMPNAVIGIKKWNADHKEDVVNFILAASEGGDQVKSYQEALDKAGEISADVYKEQDGKYWVKYSKGVTQQDKQGLNVELGGSVQFNLADNLNTFGLAPNSTNTYAVIYNTFGNLGKGLYPDLYPEFAKVEDILNLTYLGEAKAKAGSSITDATTQTYASGSVSQVVAEKPYTIEFALNSAQLTPSGEATVQKIYESLIVAQGLKVEVDGYTDATGDENTNRTLSQARADAIKNKLQQLSSMNFPDSRIRTQGYGSANPVASNATEAGRAKNRRVVIKMGN